MKSFGLSFLVPIAAAAFFSVAHADIVASTPDRAVQSAVEGVVTSIKADTQARQGDLGKITSVVEKQFVPYTDFERTTRLAVGAKVWNNATPEQQKQLVDQFRTMLVRSYAVSLSQLREQNVKFRYKAARGGANANDIVIETTVLNNGDETQIDYRLQKTAAGWRIYDINMMGAWLIEVYRRQFSDIVSNSGVDGLLKHMARHNARLSENA